VVGCSTTGLKLLGKCAATHSKVASLPKAPPIDKWRIL